MQEFNRSTARLQAGLLFLASVALLIPSAISRADATPEALFTEKLSIGLSMLLMLAYALGLVFSLEDASRILRQRRARRGRRGDIGRSASRSRRSLVVTVLVALVSEVFVASVQDAALALGMTQAFVGFIVVALVGAAAEMAAAFSGARKNRLDLSVGIALGSASQIALFVAPVLVLLSYVVGPAPMSLQLWPGAVTMIVIATLTAALVTTSGRSAWFIGVLVLIVYATLALTLYLLPPPAG